MLQQLVTLLESTQHWLLDLGWLGLVAFAGMFVIAQLFMVPVAPMGMAAGLFFGFALGWSGLMVGCAAGATINFLISRHFARAYVTRKLGNNVKFRVIEKAIEQGGWKIIVLLRFVPIPFGLANYCYGLTPIAFWPYFGATLIAVAGPNALFAWMGSTFNGALSDLVGKGRPHSPFEYAFPVIGLIAAILTLRYVAKVARETVAKSSLGPE